VQKRVGVFLAESDRDRGGRRGVVGAEMVVYGELEGDVSEAGPVV
jgi:hypothetical protein